MDVSVRAYVYGVGAASTVKYETPPAPRKFINGSIERMNGCGEFAGSRSVAIFVNSPPRSFKSR